MVTGSEQMLALVRRGGLVQGWGRGRPQGQGVEERGEEVERITPQNSSGKRGWVGEQRNRAAAKGDGGIKGMFVCWFPFICFMLKR